MERCVAFMSGFKCKDPGMLLHFKNRVDHMFNRSGCSMESSFDCLASGQDPSEELAANLIIY